MESWMMQMWLKNHDESDWPDLSICQPNDACHVLDVAKHPSKQNIERMCSEDFFAKHSYRYVDRSVVEGYDENYASCLPKEQLEVNKSFGSYSESKEPYSNPRNEGVSSHNEDTSGYLRPLEIKDINEMTGKSTSERRRNEIYQAENSSKTVYEATCAEINHEEDDDIALGQNDFPTLTKKSQEKRGNPGKAWRPWLSWLFPAFLDAGKPGKARKAWKFLAFLERPECSSKKSLESQERALGFRGKRGFCPYKPNPEKPGKAGMTVPGVNIPGFRGKAGHANSWKAK